MMHSSFVECFTTPSEPSDVEFVNLWLLFAFKDKTGYCDKKLGSLP